MKLKEVGSKKLASIACKALFWPPPVLREGSFDRSGSLSKGNFISASSVPRTAGVMLGTPKSDSVETKGVQNVREDILTS